MQGEGLGGLKNGKLLSAIQGKWDVLLTTDTNIPWRQVIAKYNVGLLVVRVVSNDVKEFSRWMPEVLNSLPKVKRGTVIAIGDPALVGNKR